MKKITSFVFLFAVLALTFVSFASAESLAGGLDVEFNGVSLERAPTGFVMAGEVGDVVPVRVSFEATKDATDVKVEVELEGTRDDVSASTGFFNIVDGSHYSKLVSLELPSDDKDLTREYTLFVSVNAPGDHTGKRYTIRLQRDSYELRVLSVSYNNQVSSGESVPVSVVVTNNGYNDLEDVYVTASIPELGVSATGYVGDLVPKETSADEDEEDSREKLVYLKIPENAKSGVYNLEVEVSNDDTSSVVRKLISVDESGSIRLLAGMDNKKLSAGDSTTYELVVVNSASNVKVLTLSAQSGDDLSVTVPTVVTVGPSSSVTVPVEVSVKNGASYGVHTFTVEANGQPVVFSANVDGKSSGSVVALTVILVIIFVVLLAVLIVLLTRKDKTMQEVETSYY